MTLAKAQSKFYNDKQDIVEFLNIKVGEHEKMISNLELSNRNLEQEKKDMDASYRKEVVVLQQQSTDEIESLTAQCAKLKSDLAELSSFSVQKSEIEEQLRSLKALLEEKDYEYRETVHNLERKVLQDKVAMN